MKAMTRTLIATAVTGLVSMSANRVTAISKFSKYGLITLKKCLVDVSTLTCYLLVQW